MPNNKQPQPLPTRKQVIKKDPDALIIGLTATPCRKDGRGLGSTFVALAALSIVNQVLRPFNRSEVLSIAESAAEAGKKVRTMRDWCTRHDIGRRIEGQWAVSRVALAMFLDGDRTALAAYLAGDRSSPAVVGYFERCQVPLPRQASALDRHREATLSGVDRRVESEVV